MSSVMLELALEAPALQAAASTPERIPVQEFCGLCEQALVYVAGKHDPMYVILAILEDGALTWAHKSCVILKSKRPTISESVPRRMPACARCSATFRDHIRSNVPPFVACNVDLVEGEPTPYVPAEPFRSRHWPYDMVTPDQYQEAA